MSSSNPHPSAGIAKALHDLQGEIQSFGSGPYTAEQQQKMNQYNLLFQKATATPESAQYIKRPPGSSPPLVIMSSPSTTQVQVQTSSANQPVVMTTSNLRGVTSVIPQGAVLMQQAIATSIANQMTGSNQSSQSSPSKVTIIGNKGSSSLSQLSLLAQHPQGQPTTGTTQIQIKPNNVGTTMSNPNPTIQRQVLPVQAIPAGHTPVQMVASISGHQTQGGHVLTAVNLPQGHTLGQRTIAPQGIAIQQQGTPLVIQVTAAHTGQGKPTFVQASGKMVGSVVQQSGSNDSLKTPITATPKVTQNHDSLNAAEPQSVLSRKRLQDLLQEIDPRATLDEDVEDVLLQIADDFIESVVSASCQIAKHRQSNTLEARDIQMHLERNWNMWIPGYGTEDFKQSKKLGSTEAHKQRMALIRKSMKK
ncbi:transcription initiation factor TFIID subunit 12-like isoform X1 [Xenia sp. Carnegie-2017]|uniref:transcription initiation factor TFIID subunit 12-like isoform X1 n=1 Tax=Xenia sp. Carnegie-2017 TaxID=2897299 RepID=UPI001F037394|nr:transcription initiation factor TFIID subunit 12-like isoform X1 [Xenia sp. Carnegie-2017]